jgi:hypothetical protein
MSHKDSSYATTQCGIDILESIRLIGRQRDGLEHRLEENCMLITNAIMTLEAYSSILSSGYTYVSREMQFRKAEKSKFLTPTLSHEAVQEFTHRISKTDSLVPSDVASKVVESTVEIHDVFEQHQRIHRASAVQHRNRTTRFTIETNNPQAYVN